MNVFIGFIEYAAWMAGVYSLSGATARRVFYDIWLWAATGYKEAMGR